MYFRFPKFNYLQVSQLPNEIETDESGYWNPTATPLLNNLSERPGEAQEFVKKIICDCIEQSLIFTINENVMVIYN